MEKTGIDFKISFNIKNVVSLIVLSWGVFVVFPALIGKSLLSGVDLFKISEEYTFLRYTQEVFVYTWGTFIIFILPGLVWSCSFIKKDIHFSKLLWYSFLTSFLSLILITTLYKILIPSGLNRVNFLALVFCITLTGLLWLACVKGYSGFKVKLCKKHLLMCAVLSLVAVIGCWIFQDKVLWSNYDSNFSSSHVLSLPLGEQDDLMEHFGLADSLKKHLLPFWDLEYADRFGYSVIDPPLHTFLTLFLVLTFGQSFAVISLNTVLIILASYFLVLKMSESQRTDAPRHSVIYILPVLFLCYFLVIVSHYECAVVLSDHIHFMCFFSVAQFYFLLNKKHGMFLLTALLAFLIKYEAAMFTFLGLVFYQCLYTPSKKETGALVKQYLLGVFLFVALVGAIGLFRGDFGVYVETISVERLMRLDYFGFLDKVYPQSRTLWETFSVSETWAFVKQFVLATGLLGILIFCPQKNKMSRFLQGVSLVYFALILISRVKRPHYISPLVILSLIIALRFFVQDRLNRIKRGRAKNAV